MNDGETDDLDRQMQLVDATAIPHERCLYGRLSINPQLGTAQRATRRSNLLIASSTIVHFVLFGIKVFDCCEYCLRLLDD